MVEIEQETQPQQEVSQDSNPEVDPARQTAVSEWESKILRAIKHWEPDFKRMRDDMQLARQGARKQWVDNDNYVVPIIARYINQAVSALYAKNPKVVVSRKKRMNYRVWDGRPDSLNAAMNMLEQALMPQMDVMGMPLPQMPPDPMALAIVQEVSQVQQQNLMLDRVCKTLEIVLQYYMAEQSVSFKNQLKQLVRRTKICGVGYLYLGYQRLLGRDPDIDAQISDASQQIAKLERLQQELADGDITEDDARLDELRTMVADLETQVEMIVREGPVFGFPRSTSIIMDPAVEQVSGFIGADWIVREFYMTPEEVQEAFKVNVKGKFRAYVKGRSKGASSQEWTASSKVDSKEGTCRVWEVWHKPNAQTFTMVEGYPDYVKPPARPEVLLERFWPIFSLTFNETEHETEVMPLSDVYALRHTQNEYNRSRQMRRLHRQANIPFFLTVKGRLTEEDMAKVKNREPFGIAEIQALLQGEDVEKLFQPLKPAPIDPALYETNSEMEDLYRIVGAQEANMGGLSGATATEAAIGQQSQTVSMESSVDDLDGFLSSVVESTAQLLLLKLDGKTVTTIAGPGAVWPQLSREEIVREVEIDVKAGSSGRPNAAAELAKMERAMPYLLQMDGVKMTPIAERYCDLLDFDSEEAVSEGLPSQIALNSMATKIASTPTTPPGAGPAGTSSSPNAQGAEGGANAPKPQQNEAGPQPAFPQGA